LSSVDHVRKIRDRKQSTDIGKFSFVNKTIKNWNQLPALALGTFPCKHKIFRKRVRKAIINGVGSSVGIATELWAGRSGIESRWGRDFPPVQNDPRAHPASCKMGTESFPGVNCGRDVLLTAYPLLVPQSWKNRAIPVPTLWATPDL